MALGSLPSEAELSALIERYAGSQRVSCEQADLFFASIGETASTGKAASKRPARRSAAPRDAADVARGSWLDKLGPRSSAPPRGAAASSRAPALSMSAVAELQQEEPITIEQALEHLPATTYSSAPPANALPTEDSVPVALPLSSHPAPPLAAADSVVLERWGMAETTPEAQPELSAQPADAADGAAEDALLERWADDLDRALGQSAHPAAESARPATVTEPERAVATDAPERWSAPHLSTEIQAATPVVHDDDAPLSAAELSLLEQWSSEDTSEPAGALSEDTVPAASQRSARSQPPPPRSVRPAALSRPAAAFATQVVDDDAPLDVELEDEIELEPDDLIEIDSE